MKKDYSKYRGITRIQVAKILGDPNISSREKELASLAYYHEIHKHDKKQIPRFDEYPSTLESKSESTL